MHTCTQAKRRYDPVPSCVCARSILPNVGMITIMMNDYPYLKYALIGVLGLLVITNKEG